jgi:hypothetical protein
VAAVLAFEAVLAREDAVANFRSWAFHEMPALIATERMHQRREATARRNAGESHAAIARTFGVDRSTITRMR